MFYTKQEENLRLREKSQKKEKSNFLLSKSKEKGKFSSRKNESIKMYLTSG